MSTLSEGKVLAGRFELRRRLGAGGLAEVWVARDLAAGGEVAIKALHGHLVADEGLAERFRREMAVTRGLDHPGIVRVFDLYEHQEGGVKSPLFAMELLRGRTLADALKAGPLKPDEARRIAREIALALGHAHRAGVVHRDLKPQNVWICEDGTVKLLDFGLARAAGWSRLTAQSTLMGTPGYIAPEILQGQSADARADLYALGATLFEMLVGRRAFPSADPYTALRNKNQPPPSARAAAPGVSLADDAVVTRALQFDPEDRFLDAGQMARALEGHAAAPANPAPAALTRGDRDVVLLHSYARQKKALARVCERLGVPMVTTPWRARLALFGRNVLVAGASRDTAEAVAAICREEGLGVAVEEARPIGKLRQWTMRYAARGAAAATALGATAWLARHLTSAHARFVASSKSWGTIEDHIARARASGLSQAKIAELVRQLQSYRPEGVVQALANDLLFVAPVVGMSMMLVLALFSAVELNALPVAVGQKLPAPKRPGKLRRWLSGQALRIGLPAGIAAALGLVIAAQAPIFSTNRFFVFGGRLSPGAVLGMLTWLASIAVPIWLTLSKLLRQPDQPVELPAGDAQVRRLERGIARRVERLQQAAGAAAPASQVVLADLAQAAAAVQRAASSLAERAAQSEDPQAPRGDAVTLPPHAGAEREAAVDELLRMAAALDEALAASGGGVPAGQAIERLRQHLGEGGAPDAPVTAVTQIDRSPVAQRARRAP